MKSALRLVFSLIVLPIVPAAHCQQQTPLLQGSAVEYAENVQPIDPLLWPGNQFDKNAARALLHPKKDRSEIWGQIPEWQAGEWESRQAVNTRAIKYENGVAVEVTPIGVHTSIGKFNKGMLRDRKGNIWHLYQSDYWTETDLGQLKVLSYVRYSSPGSSGAYKDFYAESIDFKVAKNSNAISSVRKARTWTRYSDLGAGSLKEESVRTNYNERGQPTSTSYNTALSKLTMRFDHYEPAFKAKPAIVESLNIFLKQHALDDLLIPASIPEKSHHGK